MQSFWSPGFVLPVIISKKALISISDRPWPWEVPPRAPPKKKYKMSTEKNNFERDIVRRGSEGVALSKKLLCVVVDLDISLFLPAFSRSPQT
jgi:hypothetical protein